MRMNTKLTILGIAAMLLCAFGAEVLAADSKASATVKLEMQFTGSAQWSPSADPLGDGDLSGRGDTHDVGARPIGVYNELMGWIDAPAHRSSSGVSTMLVQCEIGGTGFANAIVIHQIETVRGGTFRAREIVAYFRVYPAGEHGEGSTHVRYWLSWDGNMSGWHDVVNADPITYSGDGTYNGIVGGSGKNGNFSLNATIIAERTADEAGGGGGGSVDLTPVLNGQAAIEAKLDNLPAGPQGPAGAAGASGAAGTDGTDGSQGAQGKVGPSGANAPCASCADIANAAFDLACKLLTMNQPTSLQEFRDCVDAIAAVSIVGSANNICTPYPDDASSCEGYIESQVQGIFDANFP